MNFVIVDLTPGTVYQVEIVGFSTDGPFQVTSDQLQFNLTTEGMNCFVCTFVCGCTF